jgi:hypothetical protein
MNAMQWSSVKWSRLIKLSLLGAVGFWLPDVLLHAVRGCNFNARDVRIVTAVAPLTVLITFLLAKRLGKGAPNKQVGPPMIAGVWLFGGLFMVVGASFAGGGFVSSNGGQSVVVLLLSIIPVYTFIMATYDGALGALLLVTAIAFFVWITQLERHSRTA